MIKYTVKKGYGSQRYYIFSNEKGQNGKRIHKSTGKTKYQEAKKWAAAYIKGLEEEIESKDNKNSVPLKTACAKWAIIAKETNRSYRSQRYHLRKILAFFGPDRQLEEITAHDVNLFLNQFRERRTAKGTRFQESTINRYRSTLHRVIQYAIEIGDLKSPEGNPVSKVKRKKEKTLPYSHALDEIRKITHYAKELKNKAETPNQHYFYYFISILRMTGMRPGEVMRLKWEDIQDNEFHVPLTNTKENKSKMIPLRKELKNILQELPRNTEYIIAVKNRQRNPETFRRIRKKVLQLSGVNGRLYNLRHSWATSMLAEGMSLEAISVILGHSSVTVTEKVYAKVKAKKLNEEMEKMPDYLFEE